MELSVIILNYNLHHFLYLCIDSVTQATSNIEAEIIVIDNASSDGSREGILTAFPEVIWLQNEQNLGFAKAYNKAIDNARGEFVCILNPDTVIAEDTFYKLLNFAKKRADLGAIGCKLIDGKGVFLPESKRNQLSFNTALMKVFGIDYNYYNNDLTQDEVGKTSVLVGAFMLLRTDIYKSLKGFDESFFMYGEDIDFSLRLIEAGLSNYYFGSATAIHFKGESALKQGAYRKNFYRAMKIFYVKHFRRNWFRNAVVFIGEFLVHLIPRQKVKTPNTTYPIILVSKDSAAQFDLLTIVKRQESLDFSEDRKTYLVDMSQYSYADVISALCSKSRLKNNQVKFIPNRARFAVGSDNSSSLGSAIYF